VVNVPRVVVAGTGSGVGKTTVATGLMRALAARGCRVAGFKVGPDFIDPSYHALATGRAARNLDAFLSGPELIGPLFAHGARDADVAVIEGVMGLFDGKAGGGEMASTAQVAKLLRAPVLLVLDASAMARSAAAMVHGFASFDPWVRVAGVILNRVGSPRHEEMLREAIAPLGVPVLGVLARRDDLRSPERHLGLVPAVEREHGAREAVVAMGAAVDEGCDLEAIASLAATALRLTAWEWRPDDQPPVASVRLAVAAGPAFSFRYEENLELLRAAGAELLEFDPLRDAALPEGAEALYLGGGFPETFAPGLSANRALRAEIGAFCGLGRPVVAECGGLLYLARSLDGLPMCDVIDAAGRMTERLALGYREAVARHPSALCAAGARVHGHEFHYSRLDPPAGPTPAWSFGERAEGFVSGGVQASYLHTHWAATPGFARRLVDTAVRNRVEAAA
jgi:cobyrinic acid a,c-diamide synthase